MWDVTDPARPSSLGKPLHIGEFTYLTTFDRSGRWLITGSSDQHSTYSVRIWDVADRRTPALGKTIEYDGAVAFHQSTGLLAVDDAGAFSTVVSLWDLTDPGHPRRISELSGAGSGSVGDLTFSADGAGLAVVSFSNAAGSVRIYDLSDRHDPRPIEEPRDRSSYGTSDENYIHEDKVHSVTFLPGRPVVAVVAGDDQVLTLWDYADPLKPRRTGQPVTGATGLAKKVVVLPDGRRALTGHSDGTIAVWDLSDSSAPHSAGPSITGPSSVSALAFRDDHTLLVGRGDGSATSWDIAGPAAPRAAATPLRPPGGSGHQVSFGAGGTVFAATAAGPAMTVGGKTLRPDKIEIVDSTDDGRHTEITQPLFPGRGGAGGLGDLVFSPSGRLLAVPVGGFGTYVSLWNLDDPAKLRRLEPRDFGDAVAFSPDGRTLAYTQGSGAQPAVILMDISGSSAPRQLAPPMTGHTDQLNALAFSPAGSLLASGSDDRSLILWNVADPARPIRLGPPLTGPADRITHVAFTPDGRIVIAAVDDGEIFLWDVEDPAQPALLGPPISAGQQSVNAIAVSPDGRTLAVGDPQGTVARWDLTGVGDLLDRPAELACARTGGGLGAADWKRYIDGLPYQKTC
jgi:WD40 repeat protein